MDQKHDIPAVVVGMNLNGLAVVRALGRRGVRVIGVAERPRGPETRSRYLSDVWQVPEGGDLPEVLLRRAGLLEGRPVLLAVTDSAVRSIAGSLGQLRGSYRTAMPAQALVEALLNKRDFDEMAGKFDLPAPRSSAVGSLEQMQQLAGEITYPCILKPQLKSAAYSRAAGQKASLAQSAEELLAVYGMLCHAAPEVIVQEWIPGGDEEVYFCLQYYDSHSRSLVSFCGRKIRQWPAHCGGTACCEPVKAPELVELSSRFFRGVGFQGLCSMEFKRDPRDGQFKLIEPTVCRTDWQSGVADINGVPIAYVAYCDLAGSPLPRLRPVDKPVKWVYLHADRLSADYYRRRGELTCRQWLCSLRPPVRGAMWAVDDPWPWLWTISGKIRLKLRRVATAIRTMLSRKRKTP